METGGRSPHNRRSIEFIKLLFLILNLCIGNNIFFPIYCNAESHDYKPRLIVKSNGNKYIVRWWSRMVCMNCCVNVMLNQARII